MKNDRQVPIIVIDKMDFVMFDNEVIKCRKLGRPDSFLAELQELCEDYGFKADNVLIGPSVGYSMNPMVKEYIWLNHHPLNCKCGSKNLKKSDFVFTTDPVIYLWWCEDCGQHYKVQANGIGQEPEYRELKEI